MKSLRRSATFWCGLAVLALLTGVWVDSYWTQSQVTSTQGGTDRFWKVRLDKGRIVWWTLESEIEGPPTGPPEMVFIREPAEPSYGDGYSFNWREVRNIDHVPDAAGNLQVSLRQYRTWFPYAVVPGGFCLLWLMLLRRRHAARINAMESING